MDYWNGEIHIQSYPNVSVLDVAMSGLVFNNLLIQHNQTLIINSIPTIVTTIERKIVMDGTRIFTNSSYSTLYRRIRDLKSSETEKYLRLDFPASFTRVVLSLDYRVTRK